MKVILTLYLTNTSSLDITPPSGPGAVPIQITGTRYPPNALVDISYQDIDSGLWSYLTSTTANSDGRISFQYTIPDLKRAAGSGDYYDYYNSFAIQSEVSGVIYCSASYDQFGRGIKTIGDLTADGLFGNGTDLTKQLSVH